MQKNKIINDTLEKYSNILLLNDFNHILSYHNSGHRNIISNCGSIKCYVDNKIIEIDPMLWWRTTHQILEAIHCKLIHSFNYINLEIMNIKLCEIHSINSNNNWKFITFKS